MEVEVDRKEIWMGVFGGRSGCDAVLVVAQVVVQVGELGEDVLVVAGSFLDVVEGDLQYGMPMPLVSGPSRKRRFCRW